jgi:hypothetical protein
MDVNFDQSELTVRSLNPPPHVEHTGAVFTEAESGITDPGLFQRRQFSPDFRFVWIK